MKTVSYPSRSGGGYFGIDRFLVGVMLLTLLSWGAGVFDIASAAAQRAETATGLIVGPTPSHLGEPLTLTATVIAARETPLGRVAFRNGTEFLGRVVGTAAGQQSLALGARHSCALTAPGGVRCWGRNEFGQLGDGSVIDRLTPVEVEGLAHGVVALAAGLNHSCAITAWQVRCWGLNTAGQLGDGTTIDRPSATPSAPLPGKAASLAAGARHSCALTAEGGVFCWGDNEAGQLGDGTLASRLEPVEVVGLESGVVAVTAGAFHSCALTAAGAVRCWGQNSRGQLGDGTTSRRLSPTAVIGLHARVVAIATGSSHTCALTSTGTTLCWGSNNRGQLGDGTTARRLSPVAVTGLDAEAKAIVAGNNFTCARMVDSSVRCWGWNRTGQLGNGTSTDSATPVPVAGLPGRAIAIAVSQSHSCALVASGRLRCWGQNGWGQLGDGTTETRLVPVAVAGGIFAQSIRQITATLVTSELPEGSASLSAHFQATPSHRASVSAPLRHRVRPPADPRMTETLLSVSPTPSVRGKAVTLTATVTAVTGTPAGVVEFRDDRRAFGSAMGTFAGQQVLAAGLHHSCAITSSGGLRCWGSNQYGQLGDGTTSPRLEPVAVSRLDSRVVSVGAGGWHSCALTSDGIVRCWGGNENGVLGNGSTEDSWVPVRVAYLDKPVAAIAVGDYHSCALSAAGSVRCWGENGVGQLGDGTTRDRSTAVAVVGLDGGVVAIAAGGQHSCALMETGQLRCWGHNDNGQLGNGTTIDSLVPVPVSALPGGARSITAGALHTCALSAGDGAYCWGENWHGQIGDGTTTHRHTPTEVSGLDSGVAAITAGAIHTCAVTETGAGRCWGSNGRGQLGDGRGHESSSPVPVLGAESGLTAILAGWMHSCALMTSGSVGCWGLNDRGQLGDGTVNGRRVPAAVLGGTFAPAYGRMVASFVTRDLPRGWRSLSARFLRTREHRASRSEEVSHRVHAAR